MEKEDVQIENEAFINTVFRHSSVDRAAGNKKTFPAAGNKLLIRQHEAELSLQDSYDFIFFMPVKRHFISGMAVIHMVKSDGKFFRSMHLLFIVIQI